MNAVQCRAALAARGFDLPVKQKRRQPEKKWGGSRCGCFGRRRAGGAKKDSKGGSAQEVGWAGTCPTACQPLPALN